MGTLNKALNTAILGTKKSDGELLLDEVVIEKNKGFPHDTEMIELNAASDICSIIPSFIAASSAYKAKDVLGGGDVYKIVLKNGLSQDTVKKFFANSDGKMTTSYHDINGKFNQAGLEKVTGELSKPINSAAFAVAVAGVMQVLSVAVGEYYRCEINQKLSTIQNDIKDIKQFLVDEKSSFVEAAVETLNKYLLDMSTNLDAGQKQSYSNEIQNIITRSRELKDLAKKRLETEISGIANLKKLKKNGVSEIADNIKLYLSWYEDAVKLMICSEFLFARLSDNGSTLANSIAEAKKFADVWRELNKALQDALVGKEVSGFFAKSAKKERNDLSALINNNLNNDRLIEESKLLISNNMMYFKKAEFYYNGEKLFIQKYE